MPANNVDIGQKAKSLRIEKKMSVEDVAKAAGIPVADIIGIEDHTMSPPLGQIVSLAKVFQVTVGEFFGDSADSPFCIVRSDGGKAVPRFGDAGGRSGGYSYESLGYQKQNRQMEPFLVTLTPVAGRQVAPNQHDGEEIIFVLEGQVKVQLAEHTEILNPGDSIYYDSTLPHVVSCHGETPAKIFAVIYTKKEMIIF